MSDQAPTLEIKEQPITLLEVKGWVEPEQAVGLMVLFDTNNDGVISAQEARANDAHESLFKVLTKLGASPDDLAIALGIEPKAVREKRQADDRAERDKMRKDWEEGQKFDANERKRLREDTKKEDPKKEDPAAGWSATWEKKTDTTLELVITNNSKVKAVVYRQISSAGKMLSEGSRTVDTKIASQDTYSKASGWPFDKLSIVLRLGDPATGALIPVVRK